MEISRNVIFNETDFLHRKADDPASDRGYCDGPVDRPVDRRRSIGQATGRQNATSAPFQVEFLPSDLSEPFDLPPQQLDQVQQPLEQAFTPSEQPYSIAKHRARRDPKLNKYLNVVAHAFAAVEELESFDEPISYSDALNSSDSNSWLQAMQ